MPLAPTQDFSFDQDVKPYANRYFDDIQNDSTLSSRSKAQLQGTMLGGVAEIEQQRLKLQDQRDNVQMNKLRYDTGVSELNDARARRARIEKQDSDLAGVHGLVTDIVSAPDLSPDEKRQRLSQAALENSTTLALNPNAAQIFNYGSNAIPAQKEPVMTTAQAISTAMQGEDPNVLRDAIESGDYSVVATNADRREQRKEAAKEGTRIRMDQAADAEKAKDAFSNEKMVFAKDAVGGISPWLEDTSTIRATAIIHALGTPDDITHLEALKTADSDREASLLVSKVQMAYRLQKAGTKQEAGTKPPAHSGSSVTGFQPR